MQYTAYIINYVILYNSFAEAPTEGVCTGQPKQPQTLVENHGSPIVIIGSSKRGMEVMLIIFHPKY